MESGGSEKLERDHQQACQSASKKCEMTPNYKHVKKLAAARTGKNLLRTIVTGDKQKQEFDSAVLQHVKLGTRLAVPDTIEKCKKLLRKVQREIEAMEKNSDMMRKQEQEEAQELARKNGDETKAKSVKRVLQAEEKREMW